jgi:ABC-2 type transport system ATP-binding protein
MRQRLVFAAALLHDPRALVIDEPMVGLDPRSVRLVKDMLCARAAGGTAVFMSTHILSMAEEIADRLCIVDRGRVNFLGTLPALQQELAAPQTALEPLFLKLTGGGDGEAIPPPRSDAAEIEEPR